MQRSLKAEQLGRLEKKLFDVGCFDSFVSHKQSCASLQDWEFVM